MRIWVSFTDDEYKLIQQEAEKQGMTPQKYISNCALSKLGLPVTEIKLAEILNEVETYLKTRTKDDPPFICSDTVKTWSHLSRSEKMCVSKLISTVVRENPDRYEIVKDGRDGRAKEYRII